MWRYLKRFLIGKPLKTTDEGARRLQSLKRWHYYHLMRYRPWLMVPNKLPQS